MKNDPHKYEKVELEIYMMFRKLTGIYSRIAGYLGKNDSSKISRQLNPTDERRDNPFREVLEILEAVQDESPELADEIWNVLERERKLMRRKNLPKAVEIAGCLKRLFDELSDVVYANNTDASQDVMEKESFELMKAATEFHETVSANRSAGKLRKVK